MKKLGNWITRNKNLLICILVGIFLFFYWFDIYGINVTGAMDGGYVETSMGEKYQNIKLEQGDVLYKQTFQGKGVTLCGLKLPLDIGKSHEGDQIEISVLDENQQEIAKQVVNIQDTDTEATVLLQKQLTNKKGRLYTLQIRVLNMNPESQVALYTAANSKYDKGELLIGDQVNKQNLLFTQLICPSGFLRKFAIAGGIACMLIFVLVSYLVGKKKVRLEKMCIPIILMLAIVYSAAITPMAYPDEGDHFYSAYEVSNKIMRKTSDKEGYIRMRSDDANLMGLSEEASKRTYATVAEGLTHMQQEKTTVDVKKDTVGVADYFYLAPALGIVLARIFHLGTIGLMYMGRFFNMLLYAILVYLGLKKMPFAKILYFVIAISPMALHQMSGFSYDALIFGLAFAFTGYVLNLTYQEEKITGKQMIPVIILGMLLAPSKSGAYLPICMLVFLITKDRFATKKQYIMGVWGSAGLLVGAFATNFIINSIGTITKAAEGNLDVKGGMEATYNLGDFIHMPKGTLAIYIRTLLRKGSEYFTTAFGSVMGSYNIEIKTIWIIAFIVLVLIASLRLSDEKMYVTVRQKVWMGIIILGSMFLIATGMFVGWTPRTSIMIEGIQGRYFLPLLPLIMLLFRNDWIVMKKRCDEGVVIAATVINLLIALCAFGGCVIK